MNPIIYTSERTVVESDLDEMNHVNNIVYLQYLQDLATEHWVSAAPGEIIESVEWVVRRHEIDYLQAAVLGDRLQLKTWVEDFSGVSSTRHYEIIKNDKVIVRAKTHWIAVDPLTHKPKRLDFNQLTSYFFK